MTTVTTLRDLQGFDLFDSRGDEIKLDSLQYGEYVLDECEKAASDPDWSEDCRVFSVTPLDAQGYRQPLQQFVIYARQ